jgi:hypothetical protein
MCVERQKRSEVTDLQVHTFNHRGLAHGQDDNLTARRQCSAQAARCSHDGRRARSRCESMVVDADVRIEHSDDAAGPRTHAHESARERAHDEVEHTLARGEEVACKIESVEAYEVGGEHRREQGLAPRQRAEEV